MTEQDQIRAIAEVDGWEINSSDTSPSWSKCYIHPNRKGYYEIHELPPYLTSRDAIVPVIEKVCSDGQLCSWGTFAMHLISVVRPKWYDPEVDLYPIKVITVALVVPATQLCEALLRATGRWK